MTKFLLILVLLCGCTATNPPGTATLKLSDGSVLYIAPGEAVIYQDGTWVKRTFTRKELGR